MKDYETIWSEILEKLMTKVSVPCYDIYFSKLKPVAMKDGKLVLLSPMLSVRNMIIKDFSAPLNMAIRESMVKAEGVIIILENELSAYVEEEETQPEPKREEFNPSMKKITFQKYFTFDNFVIGESNQYAAAAARAVAENPGTHLNPLFIYGKPGLGKTHILHAIGNEILRKNPELRVYYTTAENYTNDLIYSIRNSSNNNELSKQFRDKYRNLDVLMIDDVQFFAKTNSTQDSLFHTFNDLYNEGKQIILSSDRPIKELSQLEERLTSRFASGVVADIQPPSFETRIAILQKKAYQYKIDVSPEVINYIAEREKYNVRLMEGMLKTVGYYASLNGRTANSVEFAMEALRDSNGPNNEITIQKIAEITCDFFGIKQADICGKKKTKELVEPRQVAMYLVTSVLPEIPLATIGQYFGGRDHTTVIHARDKIQQKITENDNYKKKVEDIKNRIMNK